MEPEAGVEWIVGGIGQRGCGGVCRVRDRHGDAGLDLIAINAMRCDGLRPTFGFVPRTGAMALSWTMDKIGPITRSVEDCALVMSAIYGREGGQGVQDRSVQPAAFNWNADFDWRTLRVGYLKMAFDAPKLEELKPPSESVTAKERAEFEAKRAHQTENFARLTYDAAFDRAALEALRKLGVQLVPIDLPQGLHFGDQVPLLGAEAAAAFDELTLSGRDQLLTGQKPYDWPNAFRRARFLSAVDYIQAQRARSLVIEAMARLFAQVDVIVTPSGGAQLVATNLSGHPAVIVPNGLRGDDAPKATVSEEDDELENPGGPGTAGIDHLLGWPVQRCEAAGVRAGVPGSDRLSSETPHAGLTQKRRGVCGLRGCCMAPCECWLMNNQQFNAVAGNHPRTFAGVAG